MRCFCFVLFVCLFVFRIGEVVTMKLFIFIKSNVLGDQISTMPIYLYLHFLQILETF